MKKITYLLSFILLSVVAISCSMEKQTSVGFVSAEEFEGFGWHIGTDAFVDVILDLDEAWRTNDYENMSSFFSDTTTIVTYDGIVFDSFGDFAQHLEEDPNQISWELMSIYSVDLNPETGGEHVHAYFSIESTNPNGEVDTYFLHEHYYIIDGKIVWYFQYKREQLD